MAINNEYAGKILMRVFENGVSSDQITLISENDGQRIGIHRVILTAASEYYSAALGPNFLEGQQDEFILNGTDASQVRAIVDFCYTGRIDLTEENVGKYLDIASRYGFDLMEEECWQFYEDKLSVTNSVESLVIADKYSNRDLHQRTLDLICASFELVPTADILEMDHRLLLDVFKSDKIRATEEFVFWRLLDWFQYKEDERKEHMPEMLKLIRLELLPTKVFNRNSFEAVYKKFDCFSLFIDEYKRRASGECSILSFRRCRSIVSIFAQFKGENGAEYSAIKFEKYNSSSNRFEEAVGITFGDRTHFEVISHKSKIYVLGGIANRVNLNSVSAFDLDSGKEETMPEMNVGRQGFVSIFLKKYIYIFGGMGVIGSEPLNKCERFNTETRTWKTIKSMNVGRYYGSAAIVNGYIYVAGGRINANTSLASVEMYDPKSDEWVQTAPMINPRSSFVLIESNGFLYAIGGILASERYDPWKMCWSQVESFNESALITSAIEIDGEIIAIMRNGKFGRIEFTENGDCSFLLLSKSEYESEFMRQHNLFEI